ncbi:MULTISPECIES: OmpA family protein [Actinomadura]|uniref:OmpA family protein n=1 Tax=Actinomadura yumaensis TaxID=111807 RepID=A0ABW2CBK0_9ACTN|nr:OmpA family protein [Actinomadura sp. J1-007]
MRPVRRATIAAAVLALAAGTPCAASAAGPTPSPSAPNVLNAPNVPDGNLTAAVRGLDASGAVRGLDAAGSVRGIDIASSIKPLETEEAQGSEVTVRISADVLFDFGKADLTDAARRRIGDLAPRLRQATGTVEVSGHSDAVGDDGYNLRLSKRRAEAVKAELLRTLNGANVTVKAEGFGETKPVAPNKKGDKDDPEGRAKNRRVDITFQK